MSQGLDTTSGIFTDRRDYDSASPPPVRERRQFTNSHDGLSPAAHDLALAIDEYKIRHRRRFLSYEEMLSVSESRG